MKKYFIFIFCFFLVFLSSSERLYAKVIGYGFVNNNILKKRLQVRKKPTTKSKTKFKLHENDEVVITASSGKWYKIKNSLGKGWVKKKYIIKIDISPSGVERIKNPNKVVPKQNRSAAKSKVKKEKDE